MGGFLLAPHRNNGKTSAGCRYLHCLRQAYSQRAHSSHTRARAAGELLSHASSQVTPEIATQKEHHDCDATAYEDSTQHVAVHASKISQRTPHHASKRSHPSIFLLPVRHSHEKNGERCSAPRACYIARRTHLNALIATMMPSTATPSRPIGVS